MIERDRKALDMSTSSPMAKTKVPHAFPRYERAHSQDGLTHGACSERKHTSLGTHQLGSSVVRQRIPFCTRSLGRNTGQSPSVRIDLGSLPGHWQKILSSAVSSVLPASVSKRRRSPLVSLRDREPSRRHSSKFSFSRACGTISPSNNKLEPLKPRNNCRYPAPSSSRSSFDEMFPPVITNARFSPLLGL